MGLIIKDYYNKMAESLRILIRMIAEAVANYPQQELTSQERTRIVNDVILRYQIQKWIVVYFIIPLVIISRAPEIAQK